MQQEIKQYLGSLNPLSVLDKWLKEALSRTDLKEPWAMTLSTSWKGRVSSRVVLLKQVRRGGKLVFYTNYSSLKGRDMEKNPQAALNFHWPQLYRQIRIEGRAQKMSRKQSVLYWKTRSRDSQLSQWASLQSQAVDSRKQLEELKNRAERKFIHRNIPCPPLWGGYALSIQKIEFWIHREHRLHDRFLFERKANTWKKQRLFP